LSSDGERVQPGDPVDGKTISENGNGNGTGKRLTLARTEAAIGTLRRYEGDFDEDVLAIAAQRLTTLGKMIGSRQSPPAG
jgi:hypothetical protein